MMIMQWLVRDGVQDRVNTFTPCVGYFTSPGIDTRYSHASLLRAPLLRGFVCKVVGLWTTPDFLLPGGNAKWTCLDLLRIALTILKKHYVNNVNERVSTCYLFCAAADISHCCWLRFSGL